MGYHTSTRSLDLLVLLCAALTRASACNGMLTVTTLCFLYRGQLHLDPASKIRFGHTTLVNQDRLDRTNRFAIGNGLCFLLELAHIGLAIVAMRFFAPRSSSEKTKRSV